MTMFEMPSPEELARERHDFASNLLVASEQMAPLFDAADGLRADLAQRGYSPTAAEQIATVWLCTVLSAGSGRGEQ